MRRGFIFRRLPLRRGRSSRRADSGDRGLFWAAARQIALRRGLWACARCGQRKGRLDVHHRLPRARGGTDDPENLIVLCRRCHRCVHDHLVADWRRWLTLTAPDRPAPAAREPGQAQDSPR